MECSNFETLNIPPYRRRPLRSQTFQSLLQFISIFDDDPQCSKSQPSNSDSGGLESRAASNTDGHFAHAKVVYDEFLRQNDPMADENRAVPGIQDENLDNSHGEILRSDHILNNKELVHVDDTNLMKSLENENQDTSLLTSNIEEQSIVPRVPCIEERTADEGVEEGEVLDESISLSPENDLLSKEKMGNEQHFWENVSGKEQKKGFDKDGKSNPWSEGVTGNLGKRMESETREPKRNLVEYNSEIFTHGINIKSSKLNVYRSKAKTGDTNKQKSGVKESDSAGAYLKNLVQVGGDLGENGLKYLNIASAKKDADVPSERKRPAPQAKERRASKKICTSQDKFDSVVTGKPIEPLKTEGYVCNLESLRNKNQESGIKNSGDPEVRLETLPSLGVPSAETVSQTKENASSEKGDDVPEKKRKRVLTKERKAKKKLKAKMKLAEKNGKPAARRPLMQPVQKPKSICRHYQHGRCNEGAVCKFSHDTIPLTKSTPCSHFARHSCMKGNQCPFDHELSKYPCNNFLTKGSCSRGADCLFSHKMQASEGASSSAVKATGPDLLALSLLNNSSSLKQFIVNEKLDAKCSPLTPSPCMNKQHISPTTTTPKPTLLAPKGTMTTPIPTALAPLGATIATLKGTVASPKSTAQAPKGVMAAPKGISFLSHGKLLPDSGSTPKGDDGVTVDNENPKKIPVVAPRGINFLAFGKKPLLDVSNPSLPLKRNDVIRKSPLGNLSEGEKSNPSLKKIDGVKVDNHVDESQQDGSSSKTQVDFFSNKDSADGKSPLPRSQTPSFQKMILPNTPMSLQNVLKSTLAFASKFESEVKIGSPVVRRDMNKETGSSSSSSTKASSILELIYGHNSKT